MKKHQFFLGAALVVVSAVAFADSQRGRGTQPDVATPTHASQVAQPQSALAVPFGGGDFAPSTGSSLNAQLYTQSANGAFGYSSQNFEPGFDIYDSYIADDFDVPSSGGLMGPWSITDIVAVGFDSGITPPTVNVRFYTDTTSGTGGQFHNPLDPPISACDYQNVPNTGGGGQFGSDVIAALPTPCCLQPGRYWINVQVNMTFGTSGQWFWVSHTPSVLTQTNWKNPGGGFGTGCASYGEHCNQCSGICPEGPISHAYTLNGTAGSCAGGGGGGGGGGTGTCDLSPIEAKLDAAEVKLDSAASALTVLEGKADAAETKLDASAAAEAAIEGKLDVIEGKLDEGTDPCTLVNLLCPLIKGCSIPTTHPCFQP